LDLSTQAGAQAATTATDSALNTLNEDRASLGAQSNRFESAINQLEESRLNAIDAESRIRDLDVARAAVERSQNEVLLQGGISSLIQSNVTPQSALRLLGS
jgi:flagellin